MPEFKIIVPQGGDPKIVQIDASSESIALYVNALGCAQNGSGICLVQYKDPEILLEALADMGINAVFHSDPIALKLPERFGEQKANILIEQPEADIGFKTNFHGILEPFIPIKTNPLGQRFISKRGGGTGELEYYYARRAIIKMIAETYGHVLQEFSAEENFLMFRISCK